MMASHVCVCEKFIFSLVSSARLEGFKLFHHGVDGKGNGVRVILKEELAYDTLFTSRTFLAG